MNARTETARGDRAASSTAISDVAVIGGGIVGAAAALAAAQAGLSTVWIVGVSAPARDADGSTLRSTANDARDLRVYALSPSTQRFLERLRIWSQLDASRLAPVFDMRIYADRSGPSALHFGAYESAAERLATIVEHRALQRVLDTAAGFFPGIERVDGFASGVTFDDERAIVATDRGPRSARLVVGADGAKSIVRDAAGIAAHERPYGQRAVVGNFACARPHAGAAFQWFTDEGVVALLPLAPRAGDAATDAVSLVWSADDALAATLMRDGPDAVAARLSTLAAERPATAIGPFAALGPLADVPLSMLSTDRLIAPRAALVGDAAHVIHPLAGQGLNLGLQDVERLIAVLAGRESFRDCGDRVLLRRYERARAEPVHAMRQATDGLARLFASRLDPVVRWRGLGLRLVDRVAPVKRLMIRHAAGET